MHKHSYCISRCSGRALRWQGSTHVADLAGLAVRASWKLGKGGVGGARRKKRCLFAATITAAQGQPLETHLPSIPTSGKWTHPFWYGSTVMSFRAVEINARFWHTSSLIPLLIVLHLAQPSRCTDICSRSFEGGLVLTATLPVLVSFHVYTLR